MLEHMVKELLRHKAVTLKDIIGSTDRQQAFHSGQIVMLLQIAEDLLGVEFARELSDI